jgi:2-C-methyl-D-erythritol 2,4-cyclodiphosphate synthase
MRIGQGFDAHCLAVGRKLVLGGVTIPHEMGLLGHSDADVLVHAIMDALLGAAGAGDIGHHFPDNDPQFRDADSLNLLRSVGGIVRDAGLWIGNIDATIIAERPKLAGFIPEMRRRTAAVLEISIEQVNIKATTTEGLGFSGRGEGIAALATVLLAAETIAERPRK